VGRRRKKEARNERREDRREEERKEKERKKGRKEKWGEGGRGEEGGRKDSGERREKGVCSIHTLLYTIWLTSTTSLSVLTYVSIVFLPLLCPPPLGQTVRGVLCEYGEYMAARGSNGWIEGGWNAHLDERPIGIEGWCVMYA